jgi:ABC-type Fe3+-citrate transport system substrate-binding protein
MMNILKLLAMLLLTMYLLIACSSDNHEHGGEAATEEHAGDAAEKKEHGGEEAEKKEHGGEAAEEK